MTPASLLTPGLTFGSRCLRANSQHVRRRRIYAWTQRTTRPVLTIYARSITSNNKDMEVFCDERVEEVLRKDFDYVFYGLQVPRSSAERTYTESVTAPFTIGDIDLVPLELTYCISNFPCTGLELVISPTLRMRTAISAR